MIEKDINIDENILYKIGVDSVREKVSFNISKEDEKYCYILNDIFWQTVGLDATS